MTALRAAAMLLALLVLPAGQAAAQDDDAAGTWSFSAAVYAYGVPGDEDYLQPTVSADRDRLHLEARYNYEDKDTGSVWVGANFSGGESVSWEITPMIGVVFGDTRGVAPGYKGSLGWRKLELYSEGEYVFDSGGSSDNFFYNWSELTLAPLDWLRFGIVAQRTRAHEADRELERGPLVGVSLGALDLSAYLLDADDGESTVIVAAALSW